MEKVYVVGYQSPDVSPRFIEIKGIFLSREQATSFRESLFEAEGEETQTFTFFLINENLDGKA